ncbi:MAG: glutamate formimidoyltransferase [Bacteroidaceae bacterium]|nr:glutamate formimidoyltransferase [Bacteroidaceae bacterium]
MKRVMECVPNFSEGRDRDVIDKIADAIASADEVKILNIDPGEAANRTVITFIGSPEAVCEAAFRGVKEAARLIDMRSHHGTHPRLGATDVLPLVPVSGITLEECAVMARELASRIFRELGIASYCYEAAAYRPERRNLAVCRSGQYEALPQKMSDPEKRPDFGPETYDEVTAKAGAINIGARNYLIAVNFNLDSKSAGLADEIACDVREKGRKVGIGADGKTLWKRGPLKGCKSIGWYIEEYGVAQVSMNITDIDATPLHTAYEEVCRAAQARGCRVTGTEIIGLVPKRVLVEAGRHFLGKDKVTEDTDEDILIGAAVRFMGLDDLCPFDPKSRIIEFLADF